MNISENILLLLSQKVQNLGFKQSLIEISKIAFECMPIDRFTVWRFTKNNTFTCEFKMEDGVSKFDYEFVLDLNKYTNYSKALHNEKIMIANDVYNSNYIFEMDDHLKLNNICSVINVPIFVDGLLSGMVVMSTVGRYLTWKQEDIQFGLDVSQVVSIAYVSSKRNEDLLDLNKCAEKLNAINTDLQKVIEEKNKKFIEYGFINSHLLNAPLSRLKGLMNLLMYEIENEKRELEINNLIKMILHEYEDMDNVVTQISVLVSKGEEFDRTKIK